MIDPIPLIPRTGDPIVSAPPVFIVPENVQPLPPVSPEKKPRGDVRPAGPFDLPLVPGPGAVPKIVVETIPKIFPLIDFGWPALAPGF
jgi:hypothetical protein